MVAGDRTAAELLACPQGSKQAMRFYTFGLKIYIHNKLNKKMKIIQLNEMLGLQFRRSTTVFGASDAAISL